MHSYVLPSFLITILISVTAVFQPATSSAQAAQPAPNARSLPVLPAYQHPRVFTTAAELPTIKKNLTSEGFGAVYSPWLRNSAAGQSNPNSYLGSLAALNITVDSVTEDHINDFFFRFNEGSSYNLAVMSLWGALFTEGDEYYVAAARDTAIQAAVNHSILIEHTERRHRQNNYTGLRAETESNIKSHWNARSNYSFTLSHTWRNGGLGLALAYDMLYHNMTTAQQAQARRGLSLATTGWNKHGGERPEPLGLDGRAVSNHYGYQGDELVMLAAIYGENGFSQADWNQGVKVILNYFRVGFYESGYPLEDSYGPNLGMREGTRGLVAMARQGVNEFRARPQQMYNIMSYVAHDIEAVPNSSLIGGESGGNYAFNPNSTSGENPFALYPTFAIIYKHLYPNDPLVDQVYRWRVGEDYRRQIRWQGLVDYAFFGQDYLPQSSDQLELTKFFPQRGKLIVRDTTGDQATQFAFDARPDGSNVGHDKAGRGFFSLNALGRRWVSHIDFRYTRYSTESSTMHIDGIGQGYKTPNVKIAEAPVDDGLVVSMTADLEYSYDWQWSEPWTWSATDTPRPSASDWEHETTDPREFYTVAPAPNWLGDTLWDDESTGYRGMWMWRRPNQPVEKAFRSVAYVRTQRPFVIIADDFKKDNNVHLYESYMQLPFDLDQMTTSGNDAILWADGDNRRLLVRVVQANSHNNSTVTFKNQAFETSVAKMDARRLIIGLRAVEPELKVMLFPHHAGDALPQTDWNPQMTRLTVDNVTIAVDKSNGYASFRRADATLEIGAENATLNGSFQIGADGNAEGGQFIHVPNGTPGGGSADFDFIVTEPGFYAIEGDVHAPNGNDDSFFVRINDDPKTYLWDVRGTGYASDFVNNRGETSQVIVHLEPGEHKVRVIRREDGTRLDTLRLIKLAPDAILDLEGESATLTGSFEIGSDPTASDGKYIHVPNGLPGAGSASFTFRVTDAGHYAIQGNVYAPNGGDDSFLVRVNDNLEIYTWDTAWNTTYDSDFVNQRGITSQVNVYLPQGFHTVTILRREDGTRLDRLRLVPLFDPAPGPIDPGFPTEPTGPSLRVNTGGPALDRFDTDAHFSGGRVYSTSASIVGGGAATDIYKSERWGNFTYTLPGLPPNTPYTVKLHFAEIYFNDPGRRLFNVAINGVEVLSSYDVLQAAGGKNIAQVETFTTQSTSAGAVTIEFTAVVDNAKISGIEILPQAGPQSAAVLAVNSAGSAQMGFEADGYFSGGRTATTRAAIAGATSAPQSLYQSVRWSNFTYTLPGLTPGASHQLRLHFNESWASATGRRVFDVLANGTTILPAYDVFQAAGGMHRAKVETVYITADANGQITLSFRAIVNHPMISGIEAFRLGSDPIAAATTATSRQAPATSASQARRSARMQLKQPTTTSLDTHASLLRSFTARQTEAGIEFQWTTGMEHDVLGFNLLVKTAKGLQAVNKRLIVAGATMGHYEFVLPKAVGGRYLLEQVSTDLIAKRQDWVAIPSIDARPKPGIQTFPTTLQEFTTENETNIFVEISPGARALDVTDPLHPLHLKGEVLEAEGRIGLYFHISANRSVLIQMDSK